MAEKIDGRWQEEFIRGSEGAGHYLSLVVTRKGVEVWGAYDSGYGGFEPIHVTWRELLDAKGRVDNGQSR